MRAGFRWILIPVVAAIIVGLDQWTKSLIEAKIPLHGTYTPFPALAQYFNLVHWTNTGAAFGLLRGQAGLFVVIAIVVVVAVLLFARFLPLETWPMRLALGLQLGGAVGNLVDRLHQQGKVTDFLLFSLPVGGRVYQWPAFNVADSSIVVGTILLGILLLWGERQHPAEASNSPA